MHLYLSVYISVPESQPLHWHESSTDNWDCLGRVQDSQETVLSRDVQSNYHCRELEWRHKIHNSWQNIITKCQQMGQDIEIWLFVPKKNTIWSSNYNNSEPDRKNRKTNTFYGINWGESWGFLQKTQLSTGTLEFTWMHLVLELNFNHYSH